MVEGIFCCIFRNFSFYSCVNFHLFLVLLFYYFMLCFVGLAGSKLPGGRIPGLGNIPGMGNVGGGGGHGSPASSSQGLLTKSANFIFLVCTFNKISVMFLSCKPQPKTCCREDTIRLVRTRQAAVPGGGQQRPGPDLQRPVPRPSGRQRVGSHGQGRPAL